MRTKTAISTVFGLIALDKQGRVDPGCWDRVVHSKKSLRIYDGVMGELIGEVIHRSSRYFLYMDVSGERSFFVLPPDPELWVVNHYVTLFYQAFGSLTHLLPGSLKPFRGNLFMDSVTVSSEFDKDLFSTIMQSFTIRHKSTLVQFFASDYVSICPLDFSRFSAMSRQARKLHFIISSDNLLHQSDCLKLKCLLQFLSLSGYDLYKEVYGYLSRSEIF